MSTSRLAVRLLGHLEIEAPRSRVRLTGRQAQALFALLVLDRRRRPREAIAADLWPDGGGSSMACLRQALWLVRTAFAGAGVDPEAILEVEPDVIGIRPEAWVELDVTSFEAAARQRGLRPMSAVDLYRGDLVESLGHECFAAERERLSDLYEDALAAAAADRLSDGEMDEARVAAERLLARDPLREEAHAVLIAVYGLTGTRSQVVRQYRRLQDILRRELDVDPLPETDVVYRGALARAIADSRRRSAAGAFASPAFASALVAQG